MSIPASISRAAGPSAGFSMKMRLSDRGTPRESPQSDYWEGCNTVAYPFWAVLQALRGIMY